MAIFELMIFCLIPSKRFGLLPYFVISFEISLLRSLARTVFTTLKICFVVTLKPWYSSFLIFSFSIDFQFAALHHEQ